MRSRSPGEITATIRAWFGDYGWLASPNKTELFLHWSDLDFPADLPLLKAGLEVTLTPESTPTGWRARKVRLASTPELAE